MRHSGLFIVPCITKSMFMFMITFGACLVFLEVGLGLSESSSEALLQDPWETFPSAR